MSTGRHSCRPVGTRPRLGRVGAGARSADRRRGGGDWLAGRTRTDRRTRRWDHPPADHDRPAACTCGRRTRQPDVPRGVDLEETTWEMRAEFADLRHRGRSRAMEGRCLLDRGSILLPAGRSSVTGAPSSPSAWRSSSSAVARSAPSGSTLASVLRVFLGAFLAHAIEAVANDWGMGDANSKIAPPSMFRPVSTPAHEISTLAIFVLAVTTAIFVIVSGLLTYSVIRFRSRRGDDGSEPPQIYGSAPVEFAWTAVPVLIVFVLILTTARSVYTVQAARRPPRSVAVRVVGHQWWWEFQYPELGIVTANELHVPLSDPRDPLPTFLELTSADVVHSFWVPQLAGKTDVIPNKTNVMWMDPQEAGT